MNNSSVHAHSVFDREAGFENFVDRPPNYKQSLWYVDDGELHDPGERFISECRPLVEQIMEGGEAPLETAPIPGGLVKFVDTFVRDMRIIPTELSSVEDVVSAFMTFLDYTEPYYLFVDSAVQIISNELKSTYRHRKSGSVLPAEEVETFKVIEGWSFEPYQKIVQVLSHPATRQLILGEAVYRPSTGERLTKEDILCKLDEILYWDTECFAMYVTDILARHYGNMPNQSMDDVMIRSLDSYQARDHLFWYAAFVGCMLWTRSPFALPFLVEYHPIYSSLLYLDTNRQVQYVPNSGGEAVIWNWDVYTHEHLIVEANTPPGTCESCKQTLHCTKYVNARALFAPTCSCGGTIDVEDHNLRNHGYSERCRPYKEANPPFNAYVCQRCLNMAIHKLHNTIRCGRAKCPATSCPHHAGKGAYVAELSKQRRMSLPYIPPR